MQVNAPSSSLAGSGAFGPVAAGVRVQADARLMRTALDLTGVGTPALERAIDSIDDAGRGLIRGGMKVMASEMSGRLLDVLA